MACRQIIFITAIITTLNGNVDAEKTCENQLVDYRFGMHWHSHTAFNYIYKNLTIPSNRTNFKNTAEMVFQYIEHLFEAGLLIIDKVDSPIEWCTKLPEYYHIPNAWGECEKKMTSSIVVDLKSENFFNFAFYKYKFGNAQKIKDVVKGYIEYMEPILTSWIKSTTALNPKEFCDKKKKRGVAIPTPKILKTEMDNVSDSRPGIVHGQTSRHQNLTVPNPEDFCDNRKKRRLPLTTPEILETEQGNLSDSQDGAVRGQTSRHHNFDLNKLPDEI